ncbi:hypothetical protein [Actinoplanes siamensis]|uniref:Uncharacterized protein n=1 Tax=Actinoplanes siamensis TaxID=1223317 RepID=A0A919NDD5_9ACTN|nr:hypothetical protein [Actinoplanes siamensis]GIF09118.1 hypothetical protein Asi03nite_66560 [Actinoplanes siamensis]
MPGRSKRRGDGGIDVQRTGPAGDRNSDKTVVTNGHARNAMPGSSGELFRSPDVKLGIVGDNGLMEISPEARRVREVLRRTLEGSWPYPPDCWAFLRSLSEGELYRVLADPVVRELIIGLGPQWTRGTRDLFAAATDIAEDKRNPEAATKAAEREARARELFADEEMPMILLMEAAEQVMNGKTVADALRADGNRRS